MALSIEDLRGFMLVARERSVSRAAALMGVSQQSVSERIRRLERRVGVELFDRLPYGMTLTAAGYRLLPYARRAVALIDQALEVVLDEDLVRVRVHTPVSDVAKSVLDDRLDGFTLEVTEDAEVVAVLAAVAEGTADVGIGAFWSEEAALAARAEGGDQNLGSRILSELTIEVLFNDPVVAVAAPSHPLAGKEQVRLGDLAAHDVSLATWRHARPVDLNGTVQLCTESSVAGALARGELVALPVVDMPAWSTPVSVAYRSSDRERPAVEALRALAPGAANGPPNPRRPDEGGGSPSMEGVA